MLADRGMLILIAVVTCSAFLARKRHFQSGMQIFAEIKHAAGLVQRQCPGARLSAVDKGLRRGLI